MKTNLHFLINKILESNDLKPIDILDSSLNLRDDLGFDSLMLAELTVEIEDEFNIDIFEDGIVFTISDILKKLNG